MTERHKEMYQECPRDTKGMFQVYHKHREVYQECPRDTGENSVCPRNRGVYQ